MDATKFSPYASQVLNTLARGVSGASTESITNGESTTRAKARKVTSKNTESLYFIVVIPKVQVFFDRPDYRAPLTIILSDQISREYASANPCIPVQWIGTGCAIMIRWGQYLTG